jgi:hypothetical protein
MTGNDMVLLLLDDVLASGPTAAPDRLLTAILVGVDRTSQRRWSLPIARGAIGAVAGPRLWPRGVALVAGGLALVLAAATLLPRLATGPGTGPSGSPSSASPNASPSPVPRTTQLPFDTAYIEQSELVQGTDPGGTLYTSSAFLPTITFRIACRQIDMPGTPCELGDGGSELCTVATDGRAIDLGRGPGCATPAIRIIRPYAVDCGTSDPHPSADEFADAIVNQRLAGVAHDAGTLATSRSPIPDGFFGVTYYGRVITIDGAGRSPNATRDAGPGHCWLVPVTDTRPGFAEIRSDESAILMLLDVQGELIVVMVESPGGQAGAAADDLVHLMRVMHDIRFE